MTTNSKRGFAIYMSYCNSSIDELYKAYKSCSREKQKAWESCKEKCKEYGGSGLRILGANTYFFSAAFRADNGKDLVYISPSGIEYIEVKE